MMEHAKPVEPVSDASNEAVAKSKPRDPTASLFSLHDEAIASDDLSFSNCSDKPALTLVLPEDSTAAASVDGADDDLALSLIDEDDDAGTSHSLDSSDEDDAAAIRLEDPTDSAPQKTLPNAEPVARADGPSKPVESASISIGSGIISTANLRPISRPSRFIRPDESPAVLLPAARTEIPKPAAPTIEPATLKSPLPATATPPGTTTEFQPAPERKSPPPVRVGSGQLQPNRINWKPGEPFGDSAAAATRFRWELMLTTACGTAACGLAGIWLLRTLLS